MKRRRRLQKVLCSGSGCNCCNCCCSRACVRACVRELACWPLFTSTRRMALPSQPPRLASPCLITKRGLRSVTCAGLHNYRRDTLIELIEIMPTCSLTDFPHPSFFPLVCSFASCRIIVSHHLQSNRQARHAYTDLHDGWRPHPHTKAVGASGCAADSREGARCRLSIHTPSALLRAALSPATPTPRPSALLPLAAERCSRDGLGESRLPKKGESWAATRRLSFLVAPPSTYAYITIGLHYILLTCVHHHPIDDGMCVHLMSKGAAVQAAGDGC